MPPPLDPILAVGGMGPMASLRKRGSYWYVRYRDANDEVIEVKVGPDKIVAKAIGNDLEMQVRRIKRGLLDTREAARTGADRISMSSHVNSYVETLQARGCAP